MFVLFSPRLNLSIHAHVCGFLEFYNEFLLREEKILS